MTPADIERVARAFEAVNDVSLIAPGGDGWLTQDERKLIVTALRSFARPEALSASPDEVSMPKAWVEAAACNNCGGQGWKAIQVEAGVFDQEQCQWCYERWLALGQPMLTPSPQLRQEPK